MEFTVDEVNQFLTWNQLGKYDSVGTTYTGCIPTNNRFGIQKMDVAIQISHNRRAPQSGLQNVLKLCHIRHKNIVQLIGFASSAEHLYLVYEMVCGKRLSDIMEGLSWENMLKIMKAITAGISYLHSHVNGPYVLCNISADNILVTEDLNLKIVNLRHCIVEGDAQTGGTIGYYGNKEEGKNANTQDVRDTCDATSHQIS